MTTHRSTLLKIAAVTMAVWFVFLSLGVPRRARAELPVMEGAPLGPLWLQREAAEFVDRAMKDSFKFQLQMAMINAMQFFFERFAYETAVWLASGGKAQSPLFDRETALGFLRDSALGAGLNFVNDMDQFAANYFGFDGPFGVAQFICSPTIPSLKLKLKLGLMDRLKPRQPLCTWSQLSNNWGAFTQGGLLATTSRVLSQTGIAFEPGQSDLSAGLELHIGIGEKQAQVAFTKLNESLSRNMFRPLDDKISGLTKTPSSIVRGKAEQAYVQQPNESAKVNQEFAMESISTFDHFWPMLGAAGEALAINFGVTLFSQVLQQQVLNKGLFIGDLIALFEDEDEASAAPPAAREEQARTAFAELQRPRFVSSGDYDQLTELASCDSTRRLTTTCAIDAGFVEAVRYAQSNKPITVAEAISARLLHTDWPFIKSGTAKDQDPNCSKGPPTGGYCFSNLQKLRRARIIPIGWELAANHEANGAGSPVTLGQVVDAFFRDGLDGICGTGDAEESPFCGLIDPNWVLTYPIQQCLLRGYGEQLIEKGTNIRTESCVDAPSCLERDAEGKCVGGYGYCVREKNIWHPAGQSCPGQYASCRAFSSREGAALAVLTSTIDRSVCTAENAGCRWYSTSRDAAGNWESGSRRYLNRLAEACTEANEGCAELISVKSAKRNLVSNPSFERADGNGQPDDWGLAAGVITSTDGTRAADGSAAIRVTSADSAVSQATKRAPLTGDQSYVLSASALRDPSSAATSQLRVALDFKDTLTGGGGSPSVAGMRTTCTKGTVAAPEGGDGGDQNRIALYIDPGTATGYVRGSCTFVAPTTAKSAYVRIYSTDANPIWADAIQVEEGETLSSFHDGYDANVPRTYLKVASPDLRCYDVGGDGQLNIANDHASCPSFAAGCTEADVGCERFAPQDGSPTVNGQFSDIDRCPAACVGYAAFREVESAFDRKGTFDFFIPSTARQCSAAEVGCSEFTNMDALERGGEQREYFSQLRRCEKPGEATSATYYTWEGSDTQGYQLRSFVLKRGAGSPESAPPEVFGYVGSENPDCGPEPPPTGTGTGHYGKRVGDPRYDAIITPDCRAFYGQDGTISYRRLSRTILITDDCVRYRVSHQVDSGTCNLAGGALSTTAGCALKGHRQESTQCQPASAGCRAYRGNAGGAIQTIVATDFEAEVNGQFQQEWMNVAVGMGLLGTSLESLTVGGRSLQLTDGQIGQYRLRTQQVGFTEPQCTGQGGTFTAAAAATSMTASYCAAVGGTYTLPSVVGRLGTCNHPDVCTLPRLRAGGTYELIVVGKGTAQIGVGLQQGTGGTIDLIDSLVAVDRRRATLTPTWQRVVIGPLILAPTPTPTADASLRITATGGTAFLDSVLFREVPQLTTVIKGSWRTPQACDRASIAPDAAPLAQGMLGCRAYQTRSGGAETLRSFSRLCRAEVVGCTAFHDTRNSADLGSQTFNNPSPDPSNGDDVTVPADAVRYLVDDRAKYCQAAAKGCTRFGKPTLNRTANREDPPATAWADAFLLDQPDRYTGPGAILCEHPSLFCEEYRGQDGTVIYFKDPGNRTCEYREGAIKNGIPYSGWFRSGSDPPAACDPGLLIGGAQYGIWRNADPNYAGWAGLCQASYDHCTEFVDPTDRTPAHPNGQPYHAIRTTVDFSSCQGGVSQKEGCVVLSDSSDPSTRFSAASSLAESDLRQGVRVPAINCDANPAGCKRCVVERTCRAADGTTQPHATPRPDRTPGTGGPPSSCFSDDECDKSGAVNGTEYRCRGGEVGQQCTTNASCATFGIPGQAVCRQFANDGNAIIKVQRDRSCGQWLACSTTTEALDPATGQLTDVCESVDLCESYLAEGGAGQALKCARWVSGQETEGAILTRPLYQSRNRGWTGLEYSGHSIPGIYQVNDLKPADVSLRAGKVEQRLVYVDPRCWGSTDRRDGTLTSESCTRTVQGRAVTLAPGTCTGFLPTPEDDPTTPNLDESRVTVKCGTGGTGICVNHKCVYGVDGRSFSAAAPPPDLALPLECRAYPTVDAPFPETVAQYAQVAINNDTDNTVYHRTGSVAGYEIANACERGNAACGCAYARVAYGEQARYYDLSQQSEIPPGVCDGGFDENKKSKRGLECSSHDKCDDDRVFDQVYTNALARCQGGGDVCRQTANLAVEQRKEHGKCVEATKRERFLGLPGICLERDQSIVLEGDPTKHPCGSWYPVRKLAGGVDLFNQYESAGFHEKAQYCTDIRRFEYRRNILGASITGCEIFSSIAALGGAVTCGVITGGGAFIACLSGAMGALAASGSSISADLTRMCQNDSNYVVYDGEVNWVSSWDDWSTMCPPWFDIEFHCRPIGGVGWYEDDASGAAATMDYGCGDDQSSCGPEKEAYRCMDMLKVAEIPDLDGMNNQAWTDRTRPVADPEEKYRVAATQRLSAPTSLPWHPIQYAESCGTFGSLPPIRPQNVATGPNSDFDYWEVFKNDVVPGGVCSTSDVDSSSTPLEPTPLAPVTNVAGAARHWEGLATGAAGSGRLISGLRGLFTSSLERWKNVRLNIDNRCTNLFSGETEARACSQVDQTDPLCRENGTCGTVCRMVPGRCREQREYPAIGGPSVQYVPVGNVVCTSDAECGGAAGSCMRAYMARADGGIELIRGRCKGSGTICTLDADCLPANRPCVFPALITPNVAPYQEISGGLGCSLGARCTVSRNGLDLPQSLWLGIPDGVCGAGCATPDSMQGEWCAVNGDCTMQGTCYQLPDRNTPWREMEFQQQPLSGTSTVIDALEAEQLRPDAGPGPRVASVKACTEEGACETSLLDRITVNGKDEENVDAPGGLAVLQFYGWASRNHMPLVDVEIDWGDGTEVSGGPGKYQNHKPFCATTADLSGSRLHCSTITDLTCEFDDDCPGGGTCVGEFCRSSCEDNSDCPTGSTCQDLVCVRAAGKRCLASIGTAAEITCTDDSVCGASNACVDVGGTVVHRSTPSGAAGPCSFSTGGVTTPGTQVGATSFGNFPAACSTTPFTFRHTYRCAGVSDAAWDFNLSACKYKPKVRLHDNWGWCTQRLGTGTPNTFAFCNSDVDPWITFGDTNADIQVLVR